MCENAYLGRLCTTIDKFLVIKFPDVSPTELYFP